MELIMFKYSQVLLPPVYSCFSYTLPPISSARMMPSPSSKTLVWFRWTLGGSLEAFLCKLNDNKMESPQALRFEGPVQVMPGDEFGPEGRTCGVPMFLETNQVNDRKILWAFTGHQIPVQQSWNGALKYFRIDHPNAFVLQIGKHLASWGRSKRLRRDPEAKDDKQDPVGSVLQASMVQVDDYIYLHEAPQISGRNEGPYMPRWDWVISDLHAAKVSEPDAWKPQQTKDGSGVPPGEPASRLLYRADRVKNDYVHFIDMQWPLEKGDVIYSVQSDHEAPDEARKKQKPWIQIHQMTKKDFLVGPGRATVWATFQFTIPDYFLHNHPYVFTARNGGIPTFISTYDANIPRTLIPIVTANGNVGYRLWLFTDYWNGVQHRFEKFMNRNGTKYGLFGVYMDLRLDGSIDSYSKTPDFKGGYHVDLGDQEMWHLRATTIDYSKSGTDDHIVFTMEAADSVGPHCVCVPIRPDGTIGTAKAVETGVTGILKEELSDLLRLQKIEVPGFASFGRTQSTGLVLVPNDFL